MTILWAVERDGVSIASVRLRAHGIAAGLRARGVDAAVRQIAAVSTSVDQVPEVVVFSKAYSPGAVALAERTKASGGRVHLDLCDNRFVYGDTGLARMLAIADSKSCSSEALAEVFREHGHVDVQVIPDYMEAPFPCDSPLFAPERALNRARCKQYGSQALRLVWFGNAGSPGVLTGLDDLGSEIDDLNRLSSDIPIRLVVVSNSYRRYRTATRRAVFPTHYFRWNRHTFSALLGHMDLAILPVADTEFNRCKTENRLLTCIAHDLPVVANAIPSYEKFRPFIHLGAIAPGIEQYSIDPEVTRTRTLEARRFATDEFGIDRILDRWQQVLALTSPAASTPQ